MNELYHHGIKGMHWGVRRFQNPDGTLTDAGKRRSRAEDRATRKEVKAQRNWNAKNASQLSDKELTDQILRLQREKQLKDLTDQVNHPGRKMATNLLDRYGNQILATVIGAGASAFATAYVSNKINPRKSEYDRMRETEEAKRQLAIEGFNMKGYNPDGSAKSQNNENSVGGKKNKNRN